MLQRYELDVLVHSQNVAEICTECAGSLSECHRDMYWTCGSLSECCREMFWLFRIIIRILQRHSK